MNNTVSVEDLLENPYATIDKILEIGLYIGAVFQLVAIGAIFFLQAPDDDEENGGEKNGDASKKTKKERAERKKEN